MCQKQWHRLLGDNQYAERNLKVVGLCVTGQKCDHKHFCAYVCMVLCVAAIWQPWVLSSGTLPPSFETGSHTGLDFTSWDTLAIKPQGSTCLHFQILEWQACACLCLEFLPAFWGSNTCSHACKASVLLTRPFLQSQLHLTVCLCEKLWLYFRNSTKTEWMIRYYVTARCGVTYL